MKLNEAVSELVQAGEKNYAAWTSVHEAIDEFARTLALYYPGDGTENVLVKGCFFKHWFHGDYELKLEPSGWGTFFLSKGSKPRDAVLRLYSLIKQGRLLERISKQLERETSMLTNGAKSVTKFTTRTARKRK
jgi:hypothetical protein